MKPQIKFVHATRNDVTGIGRRGHIEIEYWRLAEVFGEPHDCTNPGPWHSSDNKVRVEWAFKSVDNKKPVIFTIYDYKSNLPAEQNRDWHIGIKGRRLKPAFTYIMDKLESTYRPLSRQGSAILERPHATNEAKDHSSCNP